MCALVAAGNAEAARLCGPAKAAELRALAAACVGPALLAAAHFAVIYFKQVPGARLRPTFFACRSSFLPPLPPPQSP